jgi:hypothetical protein
MRSPQLSLASPMVALDDDRGRTPDLVTPDGAEHPAACGDALGELPDIAVEARDDFLATRERAA